MPLNSRTPKAFDLDAALDAIESDVAPLLKAARQIKPAQDFAGSLESRLLQGVEHSTGAQSESRLDAQPAPSRGKVLTPSHTAAPQAQSRGATGGQTWRGQIGRNPRVSLGLGGLIVAIAMVAVLGVSFLLKREQPTSGSSIIGSGVVASPSASESPVASPTPFFTPRVREAAQPGWWELDPSYAGFTVSMPGRISEQATTSGIGAERQTQHMFGLKSGASVYIVTYVDYPQDQINSKSSEKWLDDADYFIEHVAGQEISRKTVSLDGYPGIEVTIQAPTGRFTRSRVYLVGNRMYKVGATTASVQTAPDQVDQFLASFKLSPAVASGSAPTSSPSVSQGQTALLGAGSVAPNFTLMDLETGKSVSLSSLRGIPVLINFWGTWCGPCRTQMTELQNLYNKNRGNLAMISVSMGSRDDVASAHTFAAENHLDWRFLHDPDSSVMSLYGVTGLPATFFLDRAGIVRAVHVGNADAATLEADLRSALSPTLPTSTPQVPAADFVPAGKIRHIIITHYNAVGTETTDTTKEEIWLTSHGRKILMHKQVVQSAAAPVLLLDMLMDDTSIQTYLPSSATGTDAALKNRVYKAPRDDSYLAEYVPNRPLINDLLNQSNTQLYDRSDYNGRSVIPLRSLGNVRPELTGTMLKNKYVVQYPIFSDLAGPVVRLFDSSKGDVSVPVSTGLVVTPNPLPSEILAYQLLLDPDTYQIVQQEYVSESTEHPGTRRITGMHITLDETRDANSFPPDLFTLKLPKGAPFVEANYVVTRLLPAPVVPTPTTVPATPEPAPRISLQEFKALYDTPATRPIILDVRPKEVYDLGHIAGAISFPEGQVDTRVGQLPGDRLIVTYCQCVGDTEAVRVAQKLHSRYGFGNDNLRVLVGGWEAWEQEHSKDATAYPTQTGSASPTAVPGAKR